MKKTSVIPAMTAVVFCMALALGIGAAAPWLVKWFCGFRNISDSVGDKILISYYLCLVAVEFALINIFRLLVNIKRGDMFSRKNHVYMSLVAFCCLCVSAVTFVCGFLYMPMFFICAAMLFLFLIVRVVRMCFVAAAEIKEENDYTV
ncbi:MAG: DUF2975 domain-containing protein [Clostridia bacterium]|nr:DUF2975 domain-containing protein [Clostridia bacterium]